METATKVILGVVAVGGAAGGGYWLYQRERERRLLARHAPHLQARPVTDDPRAVAIGRYQLAALRYWSPQVPGDLEGAWRGANDPAHAAYQSFLSANGILTSHNADLTRETLDNAYRVSVGLPALPLSPRALAA